MRRAKLSLTLLAVIIILAFVLSNFISYQTSKSSLLKEIKQSSLPLLSESIYSELRKSLITPINVASSMSTDSFLINWIISGEKDRGDIRLYLNNLKKRYSFFSVFYVSDITANYYHYNGILKEISPDDEHDIWYFNFINSDRDLDLDVDSDEASDGILTIFINYRLEDFNGNLLGVVGVGVKLDKIVETLLEKKSEYNRNIYLVDEEGFIQVHSNIDLIEKTNIRDSEGIRNIADVLMTESELPVDEVYTIDSKRILVSSRFIPELGWHVIVEQDENSTFRQARKSLYINLLITFFIAAVLFAVSYRILKSFENQMENIAGTDAMTGLANRRELNKQFNLLNYRVERFREEICLLLIDLDNFKDTNDKFGHLEGDKVLILISNILRRSIRPTDVAARWGGDEFIVLIAASVQEAEDIGERIRIACNELPTDNQEITELISLSIGLAEFEKDDSLDMLIHKADEALYYSKQKGKNCVTIYSRS